ncbi:hypothetical protein JCM10908_006427 [Rhodotorula pacifica]|uniref:uncharacterized protein n=1 Tax=Rhodotorula pacifica TaxID=1495444 RepID=UPI003177DC9D
MARQRKVIVFEPPSSGPTVQAIPRTGFDPGSTHLKVPTTDLTCDHRLLIAVASAIVSYHRLLLDRADRPPELRRACDALDALFQDPLTLTHAAEHIVALAVLVFFTATIVLYLPAIARLMLWLVGGVVSIGRSLDVTTAKSPAHFTSAVNVDNAIASDKDASSPSYVNRDLAARLTTTTDESESPSAEDIKTSSSAEETRTPRLPPTSAGTSLPLPIVHMCLKHITLHFEPIDRARTLRAACLTSKRWHATARPYLYALIDLHLQTPSEQPSPLRLLASLLEFRKSARRIFELDLLAQTAPSVDVAAAASLFSDLKNLQVLDLTYTDAETRYLGRNLAYLATLRSLRLHGPITPKIIWSLCFLCHLESLTLDGPFSDFTRQPTFTLERLYIYREIPRSCLYRITLFSAERLTTLSLTASDVQDPPDISFLYSLRQLSILQPYRGSKHAEKVKSLDLDALGDYVVTLLKSARHLPALNCLAFLNPKSLEFATWPDLRSRSSTIIKALPPSVVVVNFTIAAASIDLKDLDEWVRCVKKRLAGLAVVGMDESAKSLLPASAEECERDWQAQGVEIVWTRCCIHAMFPEVKVYNS